MGVRETVPLASLAFFFRAEPRLLRIIINKPLASLAPEMKMVIVFKCIAPDQASEHEVRAGLNIETAETAHLLRSNVTECKQ